MTNLDAAISATLARLDEEKFSSRLWNCEPSLWKSEPEHESIITNSLGWLTAPNLILERLEELQAFVEEVRNQGYKHAVVLGMGGRKSVV